MKEKSLLTKILVLVLAPLVLSGVINVFVSVESLESALNNEVRDNLATTALSVTEHYNALSIGDYAYIKGILNKGELRISDDYNFLDTLGEKSETLITICYGSQRAMTTIRDESGNRIVGTYIDSKIAETVMNGSDYFDANIVIAGKAYFGYYVPIYNSSNQVSGIIFTGKPSDFLNEINARAIATILGITLAIIILCTISTLIFTRRMVSPIKETEETIKAIATGDLTFKSDKFVQRRNDEIGRMNMSVNKFANELRNMVTNIKTVSNKVELSANELNKISQNTAKTTSEISKAIEDVASGAMSQAEDTQKSSIDAQNMGTLIDNTVSAMNVLSSNAQEINTYSKNAHEIVDELSKTTEITDKSIRKIEEQAIVTTESVEEMNKAIGIIMSIADETKLLSLNASIEAARAGEYGRGFSVVADSIKKLSEESNKSALIIKDNIGQLTVNSNATLDITKVAKEDFEKQSDKLAEMKEQFTKLYDSIVESSKNIEQVKDHMQSLNGSRVKIIDTLQDLSAISEENAASTEETTAATEELNSMVDSLATSSDGLKLLAQKLKEVIDVFKL